MVEEPARQVPIRADTDVLVCGGGCAGAVAALAAAREGVGVVLVEQHGFLGGANTAAQVNGVGGWQYDLDGQPLVRGLPLEAMERIARIGGADPELVRRLSEPVDRPDYTNGGLGCFWIRTSPEHVKRALDDLLIEAGVHLLYRASAAYPIVEERRTVGAFIESKSGREAIRANVVVDCTGDGDIAARAGAEFEIGRPEDGACQPMSLIFTVDGAKVPELWYGRPYFDAAIYCYHRYHTLLTRCETAWERSGFLRNRRLLQIGNEIWPGEYYPGYPTRVIMWNEFHLVTAYGQSAAARRRSRIELWNKQGQILLGLIVPQVGGKGLYVCATSPGAVERWLKDETIGGRC